MLGRDPERFHLIYSCGVERFALRVEPAPNSDAYIVSGRGELQLAILIETMRREGFEVGVSRPKVVFQRDENNQLLEPVEEVVIDVDEEHSGVVVQKMSERKAEMLEMRPSGGGRLRLVFHAPTRGLIGYQGELLTDTRGTAVMNRIFHSYMPFKGEIQGRRNGVLISNEQGESVAYAMWNLEDRGPMMIEPGWKVYRGMIVGEHTRDNDLEVNVMKGKKLTNIRTHSKDEAVRLTPESWAAQHNRGLVQLKLGDAAVAVASFDAALGMSKQFAINLDIGHFTAAGYDPVEYLQQHHDKIVILHIKDRKKDQGENTVWGEGDTNIKGVLQLLKKQRYDIAARHLATDAVINAIIHRSLGAAYSDMMAGYYAQAQAFRAGLGLAP